MGTLKLIDHPEGGRYHEVFRSDATVRTENGPSRSALTHIYFSLDAGERSRFHRVAGDEVWNLYEGVGIRLYLWDGSAIRPTCVVLSAEERCFCHIVPGGTWQAAEPLEGTVLVGCSVAPGFEFSDFELMDPESDLARRLAAVASDLRPLVGP